MAASRGIWVERATLNFSGELCAASLFAELTRGQREAILLESQEIGHARYSRLLVRPLFAAECHDLAVDLQLRAAGAEPFLRDITAALQQASGDISIVGADYGLRVEFPETPAGLDEDTRLHYVNPLTLLRALADIPGMGLYGGFGYDFIDTYEQLPRVAEGPAAFPHYLFYGAAEEVVIDHLEGRIELKVCGFAKDNSGLDSDVRLRGLQKAVEQYLSEANARSVTEHDSSYVAEVKLQESLEVTPSLSREEFAAAVVALQENIAAGDIYQVVPARSFTVSCPDAFAAYLALRASNPSPYLFYCRFGEVTIFGASPESNLRVQMPSRKVAIRPIAGTMPRAFNPDGALDVERDMRHQVRLRSDMKEISEHIMLIDLARNDLARICEPGTRQVSQLLNIELYSRVMHLVSEVEGTLRADCDALDAYRACMNMGTLTGAPKLRATELLRATEGVSRGIYGGAVGYLEHGGNFDTAIAIRCAQVENGQAVVRAGAGVVRDSNPYAEADETFQKASAVLHAIATAQGKALDLEVRL